VSDDGGETHDAEHEPFTVLVDGRRGAEPLVYVLTRAGRGNVDVREISPGCAPREYTSSPDELLAVFERAHRDRRGMSESLYGIRLWLDGLA
jgi:hypothetical protein